MKPIVPALGVASVLWLFLGTWWMSSMVCTPNNTTTFNVYDGEFKATSADMFTFLLSSDKIQYNTETTGKAFENVANHLEKNPNKQLILTGLFGESEKNGTAYDNLGIARAEGVKDVLIRKGANGDNIRATSMQSDNLSFDMTNGKALMTGGVNFLFEVEEGEAPAKEDAFESKTEGSLSEIGTEISYGPGENMFLDITDTNNKFTEKESFKNYFVGLKSYLSDNPKGKLILTCYNDDSALAKTITEKVKSTLEEMGLGNTTITRKARKETDSPNRIAGVNIEIQ